MRGWWCWCVCVSTPVCVFVNMGVHMYIKCRGSGLKEMSFLQHSQPLCLKQGLFLNQSSLANEHQGSTCPPVSTKLSFSCGFWEP